jgi:hypothetical protein
VLSTLQLDTLCRTGINPDDRYPSICAGVTKDALSFGATNTFQLNQVKRFDSNSLHLNFLHSKSRYPALRILVHQGTLDPGIMLGPQ